jgi:gamma-glutamyltranspeptidase/glutathione hydrolase
MAPRFLLSGLLSAALLFTSLLGGHSASAADDTIAPEAASAISGSATVAAKQFMAVTANPLATQAALDILRRGGSAVDAAIAAQLVLGLVEPQASGIGGGAFMLHWSQADRRLRTYDGRETAPAAVDDKLFLKANGETMGFLDAVIGGRSVGTPGVVKLLALSHTNHGKLPWGELFKPAIQLAEQGFPVSPRLNTLLQATPRLAINDPLRDYFFQPDGTPRPVGYLLKNPAYAATLKLLAKDGEKAFYTGTVARAIVQAVGHNPHQPGKLALADLKAYKARERAPLCGAFRQYKVCGPAPPSSGGTTVLAILGILQHLDASLLSPESTSFYHLFAEASRLAAADRDTYIADPDFVPVPANGLIAPAYLARRAALIDPKTTLPPVQAGLPEWPAGQVARNYLQSLSPELPSTSHISIVDAAGNAVSMTTSIETAFGSRLLVEGFLLNNQLTDFSFTPTRTDGQRVANRVQGGKRPRSSMAPVIVFENDQPVLLLGSPGGARIIDYVAKTLFYMLGTQMPMDQAIMSPHIIDMNRGLELEQGRVPAPIIAELQALGHEVRETAQTSGLNGIWIDRQIIEGKVERALRGSSDPRREGTAAGD